MTGEISFEASAHKHNLVKVDEKKATCTEDGMKEYWTCTDGEDACGKLYADASAKSETTEEELVLKKIGHACDKSVFKWNGTSSATAIFTCGNCKDIQKVDCTISKEQKGD